MVGTLLDTGEQGLIKADNLWCCMVRLSRGSIPLQALSARSNMRYLLFGPPGVGKTTLCNELGGINLEMIAAREDRIKKVLETPSGDISVFDSADLNPYDLNGVPDVVWIRLVMDEWHYLERRELRDLKHPEKSSQQPLRIADFEVPNDKAYFTVNVGRGLEFAVSQVHQKIEDFEALKSSTQKSRG